MYNKILILLISLFIYGCSDEESKYTQKIESLTFLEEQISLKSINRKEPLQFEVTPQDAPLEQINWSSSDNNIATVQDGFVFALSEGLTTITAEVDGVVLDSMQIVVSTFKIYTIGNSHSWDLEPKSSLPLLASDLGIDIDIDWHINCNSSIEDSVRDPNRTCVTSKHGNYLAAINTESYDVITIQPFFGDTGARESDAIKTLVSQIKNSLSADADLYVYYTWPQNEAIPLSSFNYEQVWNAEYYEHDPFINHNRDFIDFLKEDLKVSGVDIKGYIPVGEILYNFNTQAKKGYIDSYISSGELYRDSLHMNNVGKFIAGQTVINSIFKHVDLLTTTPAGYLVTGARGDKNITEILAEDIKKIITTTKID